MNKLESGLLERYLGDPQKNQEEIAKLLIKLEVKFIAEPMVLAMLKRAEPLFIPH